MRQECADKKELEEAEKPPETKAHDVVIQVDGLGKCYHIYNNPTDRLKQALVRGRKQYYREFWALQDVSFVVRQGETMGIIGRNGSGKSTLLQMICGTLTPTQGHVNVIGRVAALLELGSGFNPEFSGLENVFLNASLLGLTDEETQEKLDDILAFADIGDFVRQPVKTYSSGMVVRLAFSVMAHVKPAVLVIDEALAVGDIIFQQQCSRKIASLIDDGTMLLFVSHDMNTVKSFCSTGLYLKEGRQAYFGPIQGACEAYFRDFMKIEATERGSDNSNRQKQKPNSETEEAHGVHSEVGRSGTHIGAILGVDVRDETNQRCTSVGHGETMNVVVSLKMANIGTATGMAIQLRNKEGLDIAYTDSFLEGLQWTEATGTTATIKWSFRVQLQPGDYVLAVMLSNVINPTTFEVSPIDWIPFAQVLTITPSALPLFGLTRIDADVSIV
jgi:lipopolysaccharide transport system ATP-binding protein